MGLLETLVIGAYLYTTAAFIYLYKKVDNLVKNHVRHLIQREVEKQLDIRASMHREN